MEDSLLNKTINSVNALAVLLLILPLIHHRKSIFPKTLQSIFHFIQTGLELAGAWIICLAWVTLSAIPHCLSITWRGLLWVYLKLRYGHLGNTLEALDIIGVIDNDGPPVIITSLKVLKGPCDLDELRMRIEATVGKRDGAGRLAFPKFYQTLEEVTGYACWKPAAEFDIRHHVRIMDELQEESSSPELTSESRTLEMLSRISRAPFKPGRSPWEFLVVPKFQYDHEVNGNGGVPGESKFGLVIRIHHGITDGYSLLKLLIRDSSLPGDPPVTCPIPGSQRSRRMPWWKTVLGTLYLTLRSARAILVQLLARDENPLFGRARSGETVLVCSPPISLDFLKEVKQKSGVGLSTVLFTALTQSVRKYIVEEFKEAPKSLSAVIPFPAPNHPDRKMTNKFSVVHFPLPGAEADVSKTLKLVEAESRKLATAPDGPMNLFLLRLLGVYPNFFIRFFTKMRQSTLVVSNLPGPSEEISIWGRRLANTMFWLPPFGSSGISASFFSYESHFRVGLNVDTGVVRDGHAGAQRLLQGFLEAITDLANSAKVPGDPAFFQMSQTLSRSPLQPRPGPTSEESDVESEAGTSGHYSFTSSSDGSSSDCEGQKYLGKSRCLEQVETRSFRRCSMSTAAGEDATAVRWRSAR